MKAEQNNRAKSAMSEYARLYRIASGETESNAVREDAKIALLAVTRELLELARLSTK